MIRAHDGVLGKVKDYYFDDREWIYRYLVADTGGWLSGRKVLISPAEVGEPDWARSIVPVSLTKKQIEESPDVQSDLPVSRQKEIQLAEYYGWSHYWVPLGIPGGVLPVAVFRSKDEKKEKDREQDDAYDPNLRSFNEIAGYRIQADDESIGQAKDLITDTENWVIRYLVVETGNWLSGRKVLISLPWIDYVDESEMMIRVNLSAESIRNSPEFDPSEPVNREYEVRLYDYYGRPKYWA
jgi:hypothetical protein